MGTPTEVIIPNEKHLIYFDGVCNLCNNSVDFIIQRDLKEHFIFDSLQSSYAKLLVPEYNEERFDSILLRTAQGEWLQKSDAALFIAKRLRGWPSQLFFLHVIPRQIRDFIYERIANNRYRIFGKRETCRIPTLDLKMRFLDAYQNN